MYLRFLIVFVNIVVALGVFPGLPSLIKTLELMDMVLAVRGRLGFLGRPSTKAPVSSTPWLFGLSPPGVVPACPSGVWLLGGGKLRDRLHSLSMGGT